VSRPRILRASLLLALLGLATCAYLAFLHFDVHAGAATTASWCTIDESINCDEVARSRFSVLLGVPAAAWGLLDYCALLALIGWGLRSPRRGRSWPSGLYWLLNAANLVAAIAMAAISKLAIGSMCIGCLALYAIAVLLFLGATALLRETRGALLADLRGLPANRPVLALAAAAVVAAAALWLMYPRYWEASGDSMLARQVDSEGLPAGIREDGSCWIGAEEPSLEIVEFSDYLCPYCRRSHLEMRGRLMRHPNRIRLVHKHYPLDSACNPQMRQQLHAGACRMARMAYCAGRQGRFWDMNDHLFSNRPSGSDFAGRAARSVGLDDPDAFLECLDSQAAIQHVARDIEEGSKLGVEGTPTFFVEGQRYLGTIPETHLKLSESVIE
jgi:protein-disulfide isomerase/uncharacterized membrane protein